MDGHERFLGTPAVPFVRKVRNSEDPMAKNRFEQVDELQPDTINLTLIQKSDGQVGIVHCPKTAYGRSKPGAETPPPTFLT
jgi:hypothetical protein